MPRSAAKAKRATEIRRLVSADEWAVRQDLAAAYRLVAHYDPMLMR